MSLFRAQNICIAGVVLGLFLSVGPVQAQNCYDLVPGDKYHSTHSRCCDLPSGRSLWTSRSSGNTTEYSDTCADWGVSAAVPQAGSPASLTNNPNIRYLTPSDYNQAIAAGGWVFGERGPAEAGGLWVTCIKITESDMRIQHNGQEYVQVQSGNGAWAWWSDQDQQNGVNPCLSLAANPPGVAQQGGTPAPAATPRGSTPAPAQPAAPTISGSSAPGPQTQNPNVSYLPTDFYDQAVAAGNWVYGEPGPREVGGSWVTCIKISDSNMRIQHNGQDWVQVQMGDHQWAWFSDADRANGINPCLALDSTPATVAASTATATYTAQSGVVIFAENITTRDNVTREECQAICDRSSNCGSYEYHSANRYCAVNRITDSEVYVAEGYVLYTKNR